MYNEEELTLAGIVLVVFLIIATLVVYAGVSFYTCHKKAEKQGLECEWGVIEGCMVKMPSGNWMDYDRMRYME